MASHTETSLGDMSNRSGLDMNPAQVTYRFKHSKNSSSKQGPLPADHDSDIDMDEDSDTDSDKSDGFGIDSEIVPFAWLKVLIGTANAPDGTEIGRVVGQLINRPCMRSSFHSDMDEPDRELQDLGWKLFDKRGYLKEDMWKHPIMKGTSVWGEELGYGKFLYIAHVKVSGTWRKQGVATKLVEGLLKLAAEEVLLLELFASHWFLLIDTLNRVLASDLSTQRISTTLLKRNPKMRIPKWRTSVLKPGHWHCFISLGSAEWAARDIFVLQPILNIPLAH